MSKIKRLFSRNKTSGPDPGNTALAAKPEPPPLDLKDPVDRAQNAVKDAETILSEIQKANKEAALERLRQKQEIEFSKKYREGGPKSERWKLFKDKLNFAANPLKKVLGLMFDRKYPISHYIALILVIMVLLGMLSFFSFMGARRAKQRRSEKNKTKKKSMLERMFPNSYKASLLAQRVVGGDIPTEPRDTIVGRCDNVQYKEGDGMCVNTKLPSPIIWDLQSLEELESIPQVLRDRLTKNGVLLKVFIPWKVAESSYIPDCSNAYYMNGEKSFLLRDDGFQCAKKTFTKTTYNQAERINKLFSTYKGLDSFE